MPRVVLKLVPTRVPGSTKTTMKMVEVVLPDISRQALLNREVPPPKKGRKSKKEKRRIRKRYEKEREGDG